MFKLVQVINALREKLAARDWKSIPGIAADVLETLGKSDEADAVRELVKGITDGNAHDIAVGSAQLVLDVFEGYYGYAHITVKALPGDADEALVQRATVLADYVEGHKVSTLTNQPRVAHLSPEVWTVLGNVLSVLLTNFLRTKGL